MAHKKKKKVGSTHRRRSHHRVGAVKPNSIEYYALFGLGVVGGAVIGAYGVQALGTAFGSQTPQFVPPLVVAGAGVIPVAVGKGNPLALGVGGGMLAIGGIMAANETFLNVPGISGMAMSSNAPISAPVIRTAIGQGPRNFIDQTVGNMSRRTRMMGGVGALVCN